MAGGSTGGGVLVTSDVSPLDWAVVGSTLHYRSLAVVGAQAWLAGGWGGVTIVRYDGLLGIKTRTLPPARYTDARGYGARILKPHTYIQGMAANDCYLWAWFMGGMVMVMPLDGVGNWQPRSYAAQFSDPDHWFVPGPGWAWREWLVCAAAPPGSGLSPFDATPDWPVRICALSARDPAHGRRLQPPPSLAGYTIRAATLMDDRVWVVGENEGRVKGFAGPRWALMTITLPGFAWEVQRTPRDFEQWQRSEGGRGWVPMAIEGPNVVLGSALGGGPGAGDLVLARLDQGSMVPLHRETGRTVRVNDLALHDGVLWVAHEEGLSRVRLHE